MTGDTAQDMHDARSFEERIFARFDAIDARFNSLDELLTALEEKVERRLMETSPLWEAVQAQLEELNEKFDTLNDKFDLVTSDLYEMRTKIKSLNKRVTNLEDAQSQ